MTLSPLSLLLLLVAATSAFTVGNRCSLHVAQSCIFSPASSSLLWSTPPSSNSNKDASSDGFDLDALRSQLNVESLKSNFDMNAVQDTLPDVSSLLDNKDAILSNVLEGDLGSRGEVYVAVQFGLLLCVALGFVPILQTPLQLIAGPGLLLVGLATLVTSVTQLGPGLSPWPVPPSSSSNSLVTTGLYAQVRHPLYAGLLATCVGLSVTTDSAIRLALTGLLWYALEIKSDYEEDELLKVFSDDYMRYRDQTVKGKFFPHELLEKLPWSK